MIWSRRGGSDTGPLLVLLHGLGHNAHVEDPAAVVEVVTRAAAAPPAS